MMNNSQSKTAFYGLLLIVILSFFTFSPTLEYDFIWDDTFLINKEASLSSQTFIEPYYVDSRELPRLNYFRPLSRFSFIVDQILWQEKAFGFHLTNILIHCLNIWLVYLFFRKMRMQRLLSLIGCSLFSVHPLIIQPVSWISGRTDTLCATFALCSLIFFLRSLKKPTAFYTILTLVTLALSLLAKEMAVSLPLIFLLIYLKTASKDAPPVKINKDMTILLVLTFIVLTAYMGIRFQIVDSSTKSLSGRPESISALAATSSKIFLHYIKQFVLPYPVIEYDHSDFICKNFQINHLPYIGGFAFYICLAFYTFFREKALATSILPLALLTSYIPISNIYPFYPPIADRFAYIPLIFFIGSIVPFISRIKFNSKHLKYSGVVLCVCACVYGSYHIRYGCSAYENDITLFSKMIEQSPNHRLGYLALASTFLDEGNKEEAQLCLEKTLHIPSPGKGPYYYSTLLKGNDENLEAIETLKHALNRDTLYKEFYLAQLISLLCKIKQAEKALLIMKEMPTDIKNTLIWESLEIELLFFTENWQTVIAKGKKFLAKNEHEAISVKVRRNMAFAYTNLNEKNIALKLLRDNASHAYGTENDVKFLGDFLARNEQKTKALVIYDSLLPPGPVRTKEQQLMILQQASRYFSVGYSDKAEQLWKKAITGPLQIAETYSALALLLLQKGKPEEALIYLNRCILCKDATKAHAIAADIVSKSINEEQDELQTTNHPELSERERSFIELIVHLAKSQNP